MSRFPTFSDERASRLEAEQQRRDSLDSRYTPPPTSKAGRAGSGPGSSDLFGRELATGRLDCRVAPNIAPTRARHSHSLLSSAYMAPPLAMSTPAPRGWARPAFPRGTRHEALDNAVFSPTSCAHPFPQACEARSKAVAAATTTTTKTKTSNADSGRASICPSAALPVSTPQHQEFGTLRGENRCSVPVWTPTLL